MNGQRLGSLIREMRLKRGLRQSDLATMTGVAQTTISLVERGHWDHLSVETLERVSSALDIRVDVVGRWRGGDADRLLNRRHSELAAAVASFVVSSPGWTIFPEVSFSIYGERGVIDLFCWHAEARHLLIIEIKTEFVDVNELLGTLDRKARLARTVAHERDLDPYLVRVWLIVSDTPTNRRHAKQHAVLLDARFKLDGRSFAALLRNPVAVTTGLAFWSRSNSGGTGSRTTVQERA